MKKTFKPMYRTEKASHVYKKKTLNVNDELNIRHDDDDLENVDEYWSTAVSMIGNQTIDSMDDTVITAQSDTLFDLKNIRQSLKDTSHRKDRPCNPKPILRRGDKLLSKKRLTLKPEENASDEYVNVPVEGDEKENQSTTLDDAVKTNDEPAINHVADDSMPENCANKSEEEENHSVNYGVDGPDSFLVADDPVTPQIEESFKVSDLKHTNNKKESKKDMVRSKLIFSKNKPKKSREPLVVQDIKSVSMLNKIRPLVCTNEINTAIMELDFLAYTNEESSEKAFSIFVLRGSVEIQTGGKAALLKKGEATVIGEGDVYSLSCKSKNGSALFLSYAL